ncbi:MAG: TIGR04141 family sporadically distributed protein [Anaerolineales bacterium]|nr:TIGR04141 family sporadically distributed protein [Anaerolineales bacterium]
MKTTFYLLNESTTNFNEALNPDNLELYEPLERTNDNIPFEVSAFLQRNKSNAPEWLPFVRNFFDIGDDLLNTSNSLVILLRVGGRIFAVVKGHGRALIAKERIERGFGLKVVLNGIDPKSVRTVDTKSLDTKAKQRIELISKDSPLYEFDFDLDSDVLRVVSGVPLDQDFASRFSGSDSVTLNKNINFLEIADVCEVLLEYFLDDAYQENFSFVDNILSISDPLLVNILNQKLTEAIAARDPGVIFAYPDLDFYETAERYLLEYGQNRGRLAEVSTDTVYAFLAQLPGPDNLSDIRIRGVDQEGNTMSGYYSIDEFCVFECVIDAHRYVFSFGQWFEVSNDYRQRIDTALRNINEIPTGLLPVLQAGQKEPGYNLMVASVDGRFHTLDRNTFHVRGHSRVEVCDLITQDAFFICVKKYNGSSTLSHLFAQALVSAELLIDDETYRHFILQECNNFENLPFNRDSIPDRSKITFVYAIAVEASGPLVERLPFFSQVTLLQYHKKISRMGFRVAVCRIPVQS